MAWIETIDEEVAEGELASLYRGLLDPESGVVDNIMKVHSLHPRGLAAHEALYRAVMASTAGLRKVDRELIAYQVSKLNGCHYWIVHHRRGLRRLLKDDALLARIEDDPENAGLDPRRMAILAYARKLTRSPATMTAEDLTPMRASGLGDADILAVAEVAGYYAYVNRIADGLGVVLEWARRRLKKEARRGLSPSGCTLPLDHVAQRNSFHREN